MVTILVKKLERFNIEEILKGLSEKDPVVLKHLYETYFPFIRKHILYNSGTEDDARDIFQEAMVVLFRKQRSGQLQIHTSFRNYLIGIARMLWLKELARKKNTPVTSMEWPDTESLPDLSGEISEEKRRYRLYQKYFIQLAEDCRKILQWFYSKVPLLEISRRMGYKSENYAKKRKHLCKEKLVEMIKGDPSFHGE